MNLTPYVAIWVVVAFLVAAMAVYRQVVARRNDRTLHLVEDAKLIAQQEGAYRRITSIDRWGQSLTVLTVIYGLVLAVIYLTHIWGESQLP